MEPGTSAISPDGRIRIDYDSREMRMSHWVDTPHVTETTTGRVLFKSSSTMWSGNHEWGEGGRFTLYIALYPDGGNTVALHFDVDADTVRLGEEGEVHPLSKAVRLTELEFERRHRENLAAARDSSLPGASRPPLIGNKWLDALAALGVVAALATALYVFADWP